MGAFASQNEQKRATPASTSTQRNFTLVSGHAADDMLRCEAFHHRDSQHIDRGVYGQAIHYIEMCEQCGVENRKVGKFATLLARYHME